jgi:hypothetical protein
MLIACHGGRQTVMADLIRHPRRPREGTTVIALCYAHRPVSVQPLQRCGMLLPVIPGLDPGSPFRQWKCYCYVSCLRLDRLLLLFEHIE